MNYKIDKKAKYAHSIMDYMYHLHEYNVDAECNHIYLFGEEFDADVEPLDEPGVEYRMANRFIRNINFLMRKNPKEPLLIHMKTCGGFWEEGMAIHNAIKACPNPVTILNYSHARSMSSLIFQAANKRVMMPDSTFMFHMGTTGVSGTIKQVESAVDFGKKADERMKQIYVEALKHYGPENQGKFKKWAEKRIYAELDTYMDKKEDVYLTAEDTVKWGFADSIFGSQGKYDWTTLTEYTDEELSR